MRPTILNPLFASAESLPGVGKRLKTILSNLVTEREQEACVKDVLFHLPVGMVDRRAMPDLITAPNGQIITAIVEIEEHLEPKPYSKQPFKVICRNETGYLTLVFFHANTNYLARELPIGKKRVVSGRVERFDGMLQMPHPDIILPPEEIEKALRCEPIYPLTAGMTNRTLGKIVGAALERTPKLPEWQEPTFHMRQKWPGWNAAIAAAHQPQTAEELAPEHPVRSRLAYDELLANQLALALSRGLVKQKAGRSLKGDGQFRTKLTASLPFALTKGQDEVVHEILTDAASGFRMMRLLQGDVGSGKTVVALMAMLNAAECGAQSALMAPTEILARQHFERISGMIAAAGMQNAIPVMLLTGREKGKVRQEVLEALATGKALIAIGTHALFQEGVEFRNLALAVIDEQHRFGVKQRLALSRKGKGTDILLLTATPIPRTLALTFYGDMEVSSLKERPAHRQPITTAVMKLEREAEVIDGLKRAIAGGNRAYWVCPLIDGSDETNDEFSAAEARFATLRSIFGKRVGLVHGRLSGEEKDAAMLAFKEGSLDILVATTVIEVGVDVPEATIMIVEQAERFGLAQLHQLRGRVGRGSGKSSCVLLYGNALNETGVRRLSILRETEDGFRIAEEDLSLRGSGELLGTKQSGMVRFHFALFPAHGKLLLAARDDVKTILATDPKLHSPRGQALKALLYLFEYDAQIRYLEGG